MTSTTAGYALFCAVNVPNAVSVIESLTILQLIDIWQIINELLDPRPGSKEAIGMWWVIVDDLAKGSLVVPSDPLPSDGTRGVSNVTSFDFDALSDGLEGITERGIQLGTLDINQFKPQRRTIETQMFGLVDEQSLQDDTILLVKYDSDFERDADGNAVSDDDTDTWVWHTLRVHRKKALLKFISVDEMPVAEIKENPDAFDENGYLRSPA